MAQLDIDKDVCFSTTVLWSMVDANNHMRHSAYADVAAHARVVALEQVGMNIDKFFQWNIGPVLLKEELVYYKEVYLNEELFFTCEVLQTDEDMSEWVIYQEVYKKNGTKAATVTVYGTWIDTKKRKRAVLPKDAAAYFDKLPKSERFCVKQIKK